MCKHQSIEDDFNNKFRSEFDQATLAIYDSVQIYIIVPILFGLISVMFYSRDLLTKVSSNIKVLLTTYEDRKYILFI